MTSENQRCNFAIQVIYTLLHLLVSLLRTLEMLDGLELCIQRSTIYLSVLYVVMYSYTIT